MYSDLDILIQERGRGALVWTTTKWLGKLLSLQLIQHMWPLIRRNNSLLAIEANSMKLKARDSCGLMSLLPLSLKFWWNSISTGLGLYSAGETRSGSIPRELSREWIKLRVKTLRLLKHRGGGCLWSVIVTLAAGIHTEAVWDWVRVRTDIVSWIH